MTYLETLKTKALELSKHPKLQKYLTDPKLIAAAEKTVALGNQAFAVARTKFEQFEKLGTFKKKGATPPPTPPSA